jgi:small subunit ribosomal protein S4
MRQGSEYQTQLREKQKARRIYGLLEKQFRNLYDEANRQSGITGENLLRMLELRLDNVAYRANWASSRNQSRQLVTHGHVRVNGRRVSIASYRVRPGDVVSLAPAARENITIHQNLDLIDRQIPGWLEVQEDGHAVVVRVAPQREQIDTQVREQLIVELYSK